MLLKGLPRYYFSVKNEHTIAIVAGGPHMDLLGSKLMNTIKKHDNNYKFVGIGGPLMQNAGLENSWADVNLFCHKPFFPYKNFLHWHIERVYHPVMAYYHYKNRKVIKQVKGSSFEHDIHQYHPSAFITLSNDFFMSRMYNTLNKLYEHEDKIKPPCFHYDLTHANQKHEFLDFLDFQFNKIPRKAVNYQYFQFPNKVVGLEGVGRAWQYLYQRSDEYKDMLGMQDDSYIMLHPQMQPQINEKLIQQERKRFRATHNITEEQQVIFFSPGNLEKEVKFCVPVFQKGFKEFLQKEYVVNMNPDNFVVVVCVPDNESGSLVESKAGAMNLGVQTIFVKDKYSAMAGCDQGVVHNGELVAECAAMQLPVCIMDNIPFLQAYHTQLYNDFNNELNISTRGETQQELTSNSCTPYRVSEELLKFFQSPTARFYLTNKFKDILYQMVPIAHQLQGDELTQNASGFVKHNYTLDSMAFKLLDAAQQYQQNEKNPNYQQKQFRTQWAKISIHMT